MQDPILSENSLSLSSAHLYSAYQKILGASSTFFAEGKLLCMNIRITES
jgi:hypothetical protein